MQVSEKRLSEKALKKSLHVIEAIKNHPFNVELAQGVLPREKFAYYIEQDTIYLREFARSLALLAAKVPLRFMKSFLSFSEGALVAEQEVVHSYFKKVFQLKETQKFTPATFAYTSFLMASCYAQPFELGVASILPCFWVYKIVGDNIANMTGLSSSNPYMKWIETYASVEFSEAVERAIMIFDEVAKLASNPVKEQMLDIFYKSVVLEWHFWNDAYKQAVFDNV